MSDPVNMAAPVHRGLVLENFSIIHNRQVLDFAAGEVVRVDGFTRRAIESIAGPVNWNDLEPVPGLIFAKPAGPIPVDAMRPGAIYAADAVDSAQSGRAHKLGKLAKITLEIAGAEPVTGWIRAR